MFIYMSWPFLFVAWCLPPERYCCIILIRWIHYSTLRWSYLTQEGPQDFMMTYQLQSHTCSHIVDMTSSADRQMEKQTDGQTDWQDETCITTFNSMGPNDAIWRQGSGSTLAQVMACCLTAPSHYLNQCWLIIRKVQWYSSEDNFTSNVSAINQWNKLGNYLYKIPLKSPRGQWVNPKELGHLWPLLLTWINFYPSMDK